MDERRSQNYWPEAMAILLLLVALVMAGYWLKQGVLQRWPADMMTWFKRGLSRYLPADSYELFEQHPFCACRLGDDFAVGQRLEK